MTYQVENRILQIQGSTPMTTVAITNTWKRLKLTDGQIH